MARPLNLTRGLAMSGLALFAALVVLFLFLPLAVVVIISFSADSYLNFPPSGWSMRWYTGLEDDGAWLSALANSLMIGIPAALLSVVFGLLAALVVARGGMRHASWLAALVTAPIMLPTIILAIGLYPTMIDLSLNTTLAAVIFGHTVLTTPIVFIMCRSALQSYSPTLELAAQTLGASWLVAFRRITVPMITPSMVASAAFAFSLSFDELIVSLFLATPTTNTLPRMIWERLNFQVSPVVAAVATLILLFSFLLLAVAALIRRRDGEPIQGDAS